MEQFEHLEETQLSSEAKYDGTLLHIRRDTVRLPDGKTARANIISTTARCVSFRCWRTARCCWSGSIAIRCAR